MSSVERCSDFDADRADQHGLAALVGIRDAAHDRLVLLLGGAVDLVVLILADHRHVRRDLGDLEPVDLGELGGLGAAVPVMPASLG